MDIRDTAAKYLAYRARTCSEMKKHLAGKGFEEEQIQSLIGEFVALHYLDDEDYCHQYFRYGFGKGKGFARVKQELLEKGIDSETISVAYADDETADTEEERARVQAEKIAEGRVIDDKLLAKIGRRLVSLGYSTDVVYRIVGMYMKEKNEQSI
jgi:regulatory protein